MPDQTDHLLSAADRTAHLAETISLRFARELAKVWREAERQLRPLIDAVAGGSPSAVVRLAQAQQARAELQTILRKAGYADLVDAGTSKPFNDIAAQVLSRRKLAAGAAKLAEGIPIRLQALQFIHAQDLLEEGQGISRALAQAVTRGIISGRPSKVIFGDAVGELEYGESQIQTLYDTTVSIYGREVEAIQAGNDPDTRFLYSGPVDKKTRDFCMDHVGKVYTRAEIDALDNGQLDNVFLTGGGYNCRHVWMELSAASELWDLKGRIPEVQRQVGAAEK